MSSSKQSRLFNPQEFHAPEPWERADAEDALYALVAFNLPLDDEYWYLVPDGLREHIQVGVRVKAFFGGERRMLTGYCVGLSSERPGFPRIRPIEEVLDAQPLLSAKMLELTRWIAERYLCGWGQVLESVIPAGVKQTAGTREVLAFTLNHELLDIAAATRLTKKQAAIVECLQQSAEPRSIAEITEYADCGTGPINTLRKKQILIPQRVVRTTYAHDAVEVSATSDLDLNPRQRQCVSAIVDALRERRQTTFLLHGVTGSGKTEVYIQAIREVVGYGKQTIVLVPEISLTPQTTRRFRSRFKSVAVLHSHLSDAERHWQWQRIASGEVEVIIGARSAIFAPTPHLGLIIIDEEHETTFKQETTPRYHAREVARKRAQLEQIPLVLGSATPTLESLHRTRAREDHLLVMPNRVDNLEMPPVVIVDTRNDPMVRKGQLIGRAMLTAAQRALKDGGQVILFFNMRGFTPVLWCVHCSRKQSCPHCDTSLTWHKDQKRVLCHTCDYVTEFPARCLHCGHPGIRHLGAGTQRLEEEVRGKFSGYRCLRMDSDSMKKPGSHDHALEQFRERKVDILLGTQMIAKGLDFPNVTFVGVIDADTMLHQPDFRAAERTFQLICQVAGRTGRSHLGGRVFVQTSSPGEAAIRFAADHDYNGFVAQELELREMLGAPPYLSFARVIVRAQTEEQASDFADQLAALFRQTIDDHQLTVQMLGPAPAPLLKLRDHYRYHLRLSGETVQELAALWAKAKPNIPRQSNAEFTIDVDPINMR